MPSLKSRTTTARHGDPEVALMLRVRDGDERAFTELVERLRPRVFGRLVRLIADHQEAEDLTQDVFLRLYRARKRYVPTAKLSTLLYHITRNVARNAIRHRCRHPQLRHHLHDDGAGHCVDPVLPSDRLERLEQAALVHEAMRSLMQRQRNALVMHQFQNRTYAEIAAVLCITPEATKSLLYRARVQLRAFLSRSGETAS